MRSFDMTFLQALVVPAVLLSSVAGAQRVSRPSSALAPRVHVASLSPDSAASPGTVITISFDRPIAAEPGSFVPAERIVKITPAIVARYEWRDPVTIRIVPRDLLASGKEYVVSIDTVPVNRDGARLATPYRAIVHVREARYLGSEPFLRIDMRPTLAYPGTLKLLIDDVTDTTGMSYSLHIDGKAHCRDSTIAYRVVNQRALLNNDRMLRYSGMWWRDDRKTQARVRVLEIAPDAPPPEDCDGDIALSPLAHGGTDTLRYRVRTARPLSIDTTCFPTATCAQPTGISVTFSARIPLDSIKRHVRLIGGGTLWPDSVRSVYEGEPFQVFIPGVFAYRTAYRLAVDATLRDQFGRTLKGARTFGVRVADRRPAIGYRADMVFVPRSDSAMLRVRHVNAATARLSVSPVPDSLVFAMLRAGSLTGKDHPPFPSPITLQTLSLRAPPNEPAFTDVPIPVVSPGRTLRLALVSVRLDSGSSRDHFTVDSMGNAVDDRPLPAGVVRIVGYVDTLPLPLAIVQATDLVIHAKSGASPMSVLVLDRLRRHPIVGARVIWRDNVGSVVASATTDANGVAVVSVDDVARAALWNPQQYYESLAVALRRVGIAFVDVSTADDRAIVRLSPADGENQWRTSAGSQYDDDDDGDPFAGYEWRRWDNSGRYRGLVYTERGLYRPGEMLFMGAMAREGLAHALLPPPLGDSIRLCVRFREGSSSDSQVYAATRRLTSSGTAADSLRIPAHWPLGEYELTAMLHRDGQWVEIDGARFQVLEYRTPEFLVTTTTDTTPTFLGDAGRVHVLGRYLFGAPMSGAIASWGASFAPAPLSAVAPKSLPSGFHIGVQRNWWETTRPPELPGQEGRDTLRRDGSAVVTINTKALHTNYPLTARIWVSVSDVNRQQVGTWQSLLIHSSSVYVALRSPSSGLARAGVPYDVDVQTVTPSGTPVPGQLVRAAFVSWRWTLNAADANGNRSGQWVHDTVWRDTLRLRDGTSTLHVTPTASGPGEFVVTTEDARGRPALSSMPVWTIAGGSVLAQRNPAQFTVVVARRPFLTGEDGVAQFDSPFESANVWTTVEREGVLWQDRRQVMRGANEIHFRIDSTFAPNAVVSVLLVPAGATPRGAATAERMRIGYAPITVDVSRRRLTVAIDGLEKHAAPGDTVHFTVRARSSAGAAVRGRVTVWATDEGVLSLSEWRARNPFEVMAAPGRRMLSDLSTELFDGTMTPELFRRLYGVERARVPFGTSMLSAVVMPGRAINETADFRKIFRPTAFFHADIELDAQGAAHLSERLPDNVTTFHIFAVVTDDADRAGLAEGTLLVTKPLLIRAALPRFVRAGDSVLAGGVVNARGNNVPSVTVTASASVMQRLSRDSTTRVMQPGGNEVRFAWRVGTGDSASVSLRASGRTIGGTTLTDAVTTVLPVQPTGRPRVYAVSGLVRSKETVSLSLPAGTDLARSRLTVRIGTTPLAHFALARRFFASYPYDCTEQLASHLRVALADLALARAGLLPATDSTVMRAIAQQLTNAIARRSHESTGFTYWSTEGTSPLWLNAYAGIALIDAQKAGLDVQLAALSDLTIYLDQHLGDLTPRDTIHGTRDERAQRFAQQHATELSLAWYLRRAGRFNAKLEAELERHYAELAWDDRVWYVELIAAAGQTGNARARLAQLWSDVKLAGAMVDVPASPGAVGFYAPTRPMARLMSATVAIWPDHPQLAALAERMTQRGRARHTWDWNTLDYGWTMPALASFMLTLKPGDAVVSMQSIATSVNPVSAIVLSAPRGSSMDTSMSLAPFARATSDSVRVDVQLSTNAAPSFFVVTVDEVSKAPPVTPDRRGLEVERWYERLTDGKPVSEVRAGDLVRVRLRITARDDRDFVAVEDALPAGLEAVDLSLRTSASLGPFAKLSIATEDDSELEAAGGSWTIGFGSVDSGWWTPWDHKELRDDKVRWFAQRLWQGTHTLSYIARATTAGRFIRPPAVAEEMYNAGVNGRSDGGWFRVLDKDRPQH